MSSVTRKYEGYRSAAENSGTFIPADYPESSKRSLLEEDAVLVFQCEAESFEEAMQKWYDFNGWGPYRGPEDTGELGCGEGEDDG